MKLLHFTILLIISIALSGCANNNSTERISNYQKPHGKKLQAYTKTMHSVASGIKNDRKYSRIALDTQEKKDWFQKLTYSLWDRQITKSQFMALGLKKYPTHKYEFDFIINGFAVH